jgi:ADP-ribose pyrophosphatase
MIRQVPEIPARKQVYRGNVLSVYEYEVRLGEQTVKREVIERRDGVAIVPLTTDHSVLLIKEYYAGSNSFLYSLPGGAIEGGMLLEEEAIRELREETGYRAEKLLKLHYTYPHPAISTRRLYTFLAYGLTWDPLPTTDEFIEVVSLPLEEAIKLAYQDFESDMSTIGNCSWLEIN